MSKLKFHLIGLVFIAVIALAVETCMRNTDGTAETQEQHIVMLIGKYHLHNIKFHGRSAFNCGENQIGYYFTATNHKGESVSGTICDGYFYSPTVKFD